MRLRLAGPQLLNFCGMLLTLSMMAEDGSGVGEGMGVAVEVGVLVGWSVGWRAGGQAGVWLLG